jgi:hypothetical protein
LEDLMAETSAARPESSVPGGAPAAPSAWVGWVYFAGLMMILLGSFQVIQGLVALFNSQFYVVRPTGLVLSVDYSAWGWWHLIIGVVMLLAGLGVLAGNTAARVIGIILAIVSAIAQVAFLAAYPIWGAIVITIDVIVIYALAVHGRELRTG